MKTLTVLYFAQFREKVGATHETLTTSAPTALDLYRELDTRHAFGLDPSVVRVAVNEALAEWGAPLGDGDTVVFLTAFAGG